MCSAFYSDNIKTFLNQNEDEIFGIIAKNDEYDSVCKQKDAWIEQIRLLKNALSKYNDGSVIFEYTIPRVGGRIDNVVLLVPWVRFSVSDRESPSRHGSTPPTTTPSIKIEFASEVVRVSSIVCIPVTFPKTLIVQSIDESAMLTILLTAVAIESTALESLNPSFVSVPVEET